MRSDDGDAIIVFNGEVYNHGEIRRGAEGLGVRFRSRCDTEVVLKAWLQWGRESFHGCGACSRSRSGPRVNGG